MSQKNPWKKTFTVQYHTENQKHSQQTGVNKMGVKYEKHNSCDVYYQEHTYNIMSI